MDDKDYVEIVQNYIEKDKTLYNTKPEYKDKVTLLLDRKQKVIAKNGLFANFRLKKIDKKIEKYLK